MKPISLRIADPELASRVVALAEEHHVSLNVAVQMLLGYALNRLGDKKLVTRLVAESE